MWRGRLARVKDRNLQQDFPSCTFVPFVVTALCPLPKTLHACRTASQPPPAAPVVILWKSRLWRVVRRHTHGSHQKRKPPDYSCLWDKSGKLLRAKLTHSAATKAPHCT